MIEHIWSVVCNGSSIDEETHNISLFNVLEQLRVFSDLSSSIDLTIHLEIFSLWTRDDENVPTSGKMRVFFCDPNNDCKKKAELSIDLLEATLFRSRIRVENLELSISGKYKFLVELQQNGKDSWVQVASLPILITIQPIPPEMSGGQ